MHSHPFLSVVYKDYIIPKGHIIYVNVHTLHNDPQVFPEPEKFMPERFLNDTRSMYASSNGAIQNRDHFAFGWGRRICPGIYLVSSPFETSTDSYCFIG